MWWRRSPDTAAETARPTTTTTKRSMDSAAGRRRSIPAWLAASLVLCLAICLGQGGLGQRLHQQQQPHMRQQGQHSEEKIPNGQ